MNTEDEKIRIKITTEKGIPFKLCDLIYDKLEEIHEEYKNVVFQIWLPVNDLDEHAVKVQKDDET